MRVHSGFLLIYKTDEMASSNDFLEVFLSRAERFCSSHTMASLVIYILQ